jgi:hypothetical protein
MSVITMGILGAATARAETPEPIRVDGEDLSSVTFTRLLVEGVSGFPVAESNDVVRLAILEELREVGHEVRGGENLLFGIDDTVDAEFLLAGTIESGRCNLGGCWATIAWQLLDASAGEVVYRTTTESRASASQVPAGQLALETVRAGVRALLARPLMVDASGRSPASARSRPGPAP